MRILFVEIDKAFGRILADLLIRDGYQVTRCFTAKSCFDSIVSSRDIGLVILHAVLPVTGGLDLCRELRKTRTTLPILIVTSSGDTAYKVAGLESGADDYVTIPFDPLEFLARIRAILRRASTNSTDELRTFEFGTRKIDFIKSELVSHGQVVDLSERESRILKYFIKHRGEVVTRQALLQEVWGYQCVPRTRTVDTHIVWLRQKIEEDFSHPRYLLTVHGQGYRFCV